MKILNKKGQEINVPDQLGQKLLKKGFTAKEEKKEVQTKKSKKNEKIN